MTCIVGLVKKDTVWIGGDSAGTASNMHQRVRADKKVFIRGEFIFGFCGSFRMGQLLQYTLKLPKHPAGKPDFKYLVNEFIDAVRDCIMTENKKAGSKKDEELYPYFLFGYRGQLYGVQGDYQVSKPEEGFDAVGSGADIAMGAMHASTKVSDPKKRIIMALEASAKNNAAVRPPFHVLSLKNGASR